MREYWELSWRNDEQGSISKQAGLYPIASALSLILSSANDTLKHLAGAINKRLFPEGSEFPVFRPVFYTRTLLESSEYGWRTYKYFDEENWNSHKTWPLMPTNAADAISFKANSSQSRQTESDLKLR
jgi:hypothetical protein